MLKGSDPSAVGHPQSLSSSSALDGERLCLYWASSFCSLRFALGRPHTCPSIVPPPLFCRSCLAFTSLLMLLFLRSCAVAASCCATSPLLNSTRSISFNAVLSLCYSVKGHAIVICHQCVPSWCLALTAHSPIFSVALPPGLSGYTPEALHLRKAICALLLVLLSLVLNLYSPLCPRPAR